jgi:hypothetical protein
VVEEFSSAGGTVTPGGCGLISFQPSVVRAAASAEAAHHAIRQSAIRATSSTAAPDRVIPAPTPPYAHPTKWRERGEIPFSTVPAAATNMIAPPAPAIPRNAIHASGEVTSGIAANDATTETALSRIANAVRPSTGTSIAATAPTR